MKFGYSVNTHGIGDLVKVINEVSEKEVDQLVANMKINIQLADSLTKRGATA